MQSSTDRQRLIRMYADDPTAPTWSLVGRCCIGLAVIVFIAVFGLSMNDKDLAKSHMASMKASGAAVATGSTKTAGGRRQHTESSPYALAADMEAMQTDARQSTVSVSGP